MNTIIRAIRDFFSDVHFSMDPVYRAYEDEAARLRGAGTYL